jgi:phosphate transport system protein
MFHQSSEADLVDRRVNELFALVAEAIARGTDSLLSGDVGAARSVVDGDERIDRLTAEVERLVWTRFEQAATPGNWRHLVGVLLILPELERSADLAEHVAQRALSHLGVEMSPVSRGIVQRMAEVAIRMWRTVADAYADRQAVADGVEEADEELDVLHDRLTSEVAAEAMSMPVGAQVTLLARFYERLGDHAVNLARRIGSLPGEDAMELASEGQQGQQG